MHVSTSCILAPIIDPRSIDLRAHFLTLRPIICIGRTNSGNPMKMSHRVGIMSLATANHMI